MINESFMNPDPGHRAGQPMNIGEVLQDGAEYATELLSERARIIGQSSPKMDQPHARIRVLMIRDSLDLTARDCAAVTRFLLRTTSIIASTTQYTRRKQIVPVTPSCLRLHEVALESTKALDRCCGEEWSRDDANADELLPVLQTTFAPGYAEGFLSGRSALLGAGSAQVELGRMMFALSQLESHWGSFHVWVKDPGIAEIRSLAQALVNHDLDVEEFLDAFLREREGVRPYVNRTSDEIGWYLRLKANIASVLWNQGRGPSHDFRYEELLNRAQARLRLSSRKQSIKLDNAPVLSLTEINEGRVQFNMRDMRPDHKNYASSLIEALAPSAIDRKYLELRFIEGMSPREIREALQERVGPMSETKFSNLQHRCNLLVRRARKLAGSADVRGSQWEAILRIMASKKDQ